MSEQLKKILIVDNSTKSTGAIQSIVKVAEILSRAFEFHFAVPDKAEFIPELESFKVVRVPFQEVQKSFKSLTYLQQLKRNTDFIADYIGQYSIGILHVNDIYNQVGTEYKRKYGEQAIPVIYHCRLKKDSYIKLGYPYFTKRATKYADKIVAVSESVLNDINTPRNAHVIYDPIGIEEVLGEPELTEIVSRIIVPARIMPGKGQDLILDAYIKLADEFESLKLKFVGGDEPPAKFQRKLQKKVEKFSLADRVSFLSFDTDIESVMKSADLVINFSESESFSRVCLEAQYFGVPLISSDCGGPAEIIIHGETGILVENKNVDRLADAIRYMINNPEKKREMAAEGRTHVREKFSKENTVDRLADLYCSLLK